LYAIVAEEIKRRSTADWRERLDKAEIQNRPARMLTELPNDPYFVATGDKVTGIVATEMV
jgi:crotonobetainyl-CoA:carnitine CoA-transferase CaiB-like acyl-CoA transferase